MNNNQNWITIKNLHFNRGSKTILNNINLNFRPGRHYIIAGPNGAGKSTLLDIIAGLLPGYDGEVIIYNRKVTDWKKMELARNMALAPQDYRLDFSFTVEEMVSLGRRPYLNRFGYLKPLDKEIINQSLSALDIASLAEKKITNLSGGEKQRTVLARALTQQTRILLLDEPTAGLDIAHALKMMRLAKDKALKGDLVITVTHDLSLAASYGHEFIFLKHGNLIAAGPIEDCLNSEVLSAVYEVKSLVSKSDFTDGRTIEFRE